MPAADSTSSTILVAHDGSPTAQAAASVAIQIAQSQNLVIQGLYVVDEALILDTYANYHAELGSAQEAASRAELVSWFEERGEAALQWLEAHCRAAGVPVTAGVLIGGVPELILREASQVKLLALGRRGHGHTTDPDHLGRNFRAIAHRVHWPVLVGGDEQHPIHRLLLAYNEGGHAQRALAWASLLQRTLLSEVIVVNVKEDDNTSKQRSSEMQAHLDQSGLVDYRFVSREGQPASEIVAAAADNQVDLIVVGGYRHSAPLEWLVGSTLDRVLRHTPLPVLIA
jgi:nucleotide-binding universal stress UspA family protein